ncbi:hypothetical protein TcBrA4_0127700 [Trypanosoma cruzi]|nr:hypothetical protein TcBrA4_0127700 [Trypanosoma cruzi]
MDLADASERTNYLQRCIDAKTKSERERNAFLLSAYRAIPADPNFSASVLRAKCPSLEDGIDRGGEGARRSGI